MRRAAWFVCVLIAAVATAIALRSCDDAVPAIPREAPPIEPARGSASASTEAPREAPRRARRMDSAETGAAPAPARRLLDVVVTDASGAAAAGAKVVLRDPATGAALRSGETRADGVATFDVLPESGGGVLEMSDVVVHATRGTGAGVAAATAGLVDGASQCFVVLRQGATLRGSAIDPDGRPVAGLVVRAVQFRDGFGEGRRLLSGRAGYVMGFTEAVFPTTTRDDGSFEIEGLTSGGRDGVLRIVVDDPRFLVVSQDWPTSPGDRVDLRLLWAIDVEFRTVDAAGRPWIGPVRCWLDGVQRVVQSEGGVHRVPAVPLARGTLVVVPWPSGMDGAANALVPARLGWSDVGAARAGSTLDLGTIRVEGGSMLVGTLTWPDGEPAVTARIEVTGGPGTPTLRRRHAAEHGEFAFEALGDGPWTIEAEAWRAAPAAWGVGPQVKVVGAAVVADARPGIAQRLTLVPRTTLVLDATRPDGTSVPLESADLEKFSAVDVGAESWDDSGRLVFALDLGGDGPWTIELSFAHSAPTTVRIDRRDDLIRRTLVLGKR